MTEGIFDEDVVSLIEKSLGRFRLYAENIENALNEYRKKERELSKYEKELEEKENKLKEAARKLRDKSNEIKTTFEKLSKYEKELKEREKRLEEEKKEYEKEKHEIEVQKDTLNRRSEHLQQREKELENRLKEYQALKDKLQKYEQEKTALEQKLQKYEKAVEEIEKKKKEIEKNQDWIIDYLLKNPKAAERILRQYQVKKSLERPDEIGEVGEADEVGPLDKILAPKRKKEELEKRLKEIYARSAELREQRYETSEVENNLKAASDSIKRELYSAAERELKAAEEALRKAEEKGPYSESIRIEQKKKHEISSMLKNQGFEEGKDYTFRATGPEIISLISLRRDVTNLVQDALEEKNRKINLRASDYKSLVKKHPEVKNYFQGSKDGSVTLEIPESQYSSLIKKWGLKAKKTKRKKKK